jgi:hypothetical protein
VIIVELERTDTRGIGLEGQHEQVAHESHVLTDVLRDSIRGSWHVWLLKSRAPTLQFAALSGSLDPLLHLANRVEIFIQFALVGLADGFANILRVFEHGIQNTLVPLLDLVLEKAVECQRGIKFERGWRGGRGPGDVRAVKHRIVLVNRRVRLLASQHKAWHLGR